MEWQHPEALYLILPLCAAWFGLTLDSDRRRRLARGAFAAQTMWFRILPAESSFRFWIKLGLREIAIVFALIALAGPRFGVQYEQVVPRGSDLYVLIDVSRSMLADDVLPSRLGRAKADVASLANKLEGERVGLIAFAGQAVVKCPLTVDYDSFRRALEELDPDSAPRGGTAIGDAIRKALEVFHAKTERDQAILLITDGDDQQSYPLEAAAIAAERHVTIFTVGLGDTDRGARVPEKGDTKSFLEYQGEQVWSKLDGNLLQQIALKTSGVYVPAGTKAYDLSELYVNHLQGRRADDAMAQQRIRRSERFQIFLGLALAALLFDLMIPLYPRIPMSSGPSLTLSRPNASRNESVSKPLSASTTPVSMIAFALISLSSGICLAAEPTVSVRDGLRLYSNEKFDEAREKFSAASEELDKQKSAAAAIAAFDEACAYHRKGDLEHARDSYLKAGLSQDRAIATSAHFNLGTLAAEKARTLSGEKPETVPADKRQEILEQLSQAIVAYRHCLELQPDHAPSRRNLELVRQWIKYYTDRWHELDRQKRRVESNLFQFLEFMIQTQTALRNTVDQLPPLAHSDVFAEIKRAQDELREEIPTLREKIADELRPKPDQNGSSSQAKPSPDESKEIEEGIALLREWADKASKKMSSASVHLKAKEQTSASTDQKAAVEELDRIWEAIIPFQPLLGKLLADQTGIAKTLNPESAKPQEENQTANWDDPAKKGGTVEQETEDENVISSMASQGKGSQTEIAEDDFQQLEEAQDRNLKRTRLLGPKAEAELSRIESAPPQATAPETDQNGQGNEASQPAAIDPEQVKAGLRKAIELAPQAVNQMDAAVKAMRKKDRQVAAECTEQARKILEEIQQAQPKEDKKQDQQNQDQKQQQDQNKGDEKKENEQDSDQQKQDKQNEDKKNEKPSQDEKQNQQKQQQVSQDRVEDALRKVRERQQEKRDRDRKMKGQFLGKVPVDKDW